MKDLATNYAGGRFHISYFKQIVQIHYTIYKAQNISALSKYEKNIAFMEMIPVLEASGPINAEKESKDSRPKKILGIKISTGNTPIMETKKILHEFSNVEDLEKFPKLTKKHWKIISEKIEKLYPNFDHFFKTAEDKYNATIGLVNLNKTNYSDKELEFLLNSQLEARFNIMEVIRLKFDVQMQAINVRQTLLNNQDTSSSTDHALLAD